MNTRRQGTTGPGATASWGSISLKSWWFPDSTEGRMPELAVRAKGSVEGKGTKNDLTNVFLDTGSVQITGSAQFAYTKRDSLVIKKSDGSPTDPAQTTLTTLALTVDNVGLHVTGVTASAGLTVSGELALAKVSDGSTTYTAFHMGNVSISGELDPGLIAGLGLSADIFLTTYGTAAPQFDQNVARLHAVLRGSALRSLVAVASPRAAASSAVANSLQETKWSPAFKPNARSMTGRSASGTVASAV